MAWQLHYTSARSGPTGRAGFQFVAATPGLPPGLEAAAAPYLVYRPPPEAPPSPGPAELSAFPEAFGYDLVRGHALLVHGRYLGRDYSGRYGNFFAHTVVAEPAELEGLRPIELWRSPLWHPLPPTSPDNPAPDSPSPGSPSHGSPGQGFSSHSSPGQGFSSPDSPSLDSPSHGSPGQGFSSHGSFSHRSPGQGFSSLDSSGPGSFGSSGSDLDGSDRAGLDPSGTDLDGSDRSGSDRDRSALGRPRHESSDHDGPAHDPGRSRPGAGSGRGLATRPPDELALLDELVPGDAFDPESLAGWLAALPPRAFELLAELLDTVVGVLRRGHGRIVLVSADVEVIARWIAVVSYSLPMEVATRLSFVTYSADPGNSPHRLLGTTPATWDSITDDSPAFFVDSWRFPHRDGVRVRETPRVNEGGFGSVAAECWLEGDLEGLDALGELAETSGVSETSGGLGAGGLGGLDRAALLVAVYRRRRSLGAAEEKAVAGLVAQLGGRAPAWVWEDLSAVLPRTGFVLAAALGEAALQAGRPELEGMCAAHYGDLARRDPSELPAILDTAPAPWRDGLIDAALRGLETAGEDTRQAVLTAALCDRIFRPRDWTPTPVTALRILESVGDRRPDRRTEVTRALEPLRGVPAGPVLTRIWAVPPTVAELSAMADLFAGPLGADLDDLPGRTFTRLTGDELSAPETLRLAERIRNLAVPASKALRAANTVLACADAVRATSPAQAAVPLEQVTGPLFDTLARTLAGREPRFRAALLAAAGPERHRLAQAWLAGELPRSARNELVAVALRVRRLGSDVPTLDAWTRGLAAKRLTFTQLDLYLKGEPRLRAALRELRDQIRGG